jgi:hypothetical protein
LSPLPSFPDNVKRIVSVEAGAAKIIRRTASVKIVFI